MNNFGFAIDQPSRVHFTDESFCHLHALLLMCSGLPTPAGFRSCQSSTGKMQNFSTFRSFFGIAIDMETYSQTIS